MVRLLPPVAGESFVPSVPLATVLFISVFAVVALCAKHGATKLAKKFNNHQQEQHNRIEPNSSGELNADVLPPKSPMRTPKRLLETISSKAIDIVGKKPGGGEEGVWQKNILMGDKCRPLEFSGVIYYDNYGNQVADMPRSPRAAFDAPPSPLRTFTFPLPKTSY